MRKRAGDSAFFLVEHSQLVRTRKASDEDECEADAQPCVR